MIATLLYVAFLATKLTGVAIGAVPGLAGSAGRASSEADTQWFRLLAVPNTVYAGRGK